MGNNLKEKLPLIVGVGLPILLIVYVAISYYLSAFFVKPQYDFIYTSDSSYDYNLKVVGGTITEDSVDYNYSNTSNRYKAAPSTYYYDAQTDRSRSITLSEAQSYTIDPSTKSPDGYTVERASSGGIFGGGYENGYYLKGHGFSKKINISADRYNFRFLGWVVNE
ncbi:MAG: hypothetical protein A2126_00655 [Candidatus Woykebacteria bacterium GWB1_45_5]|uniref:Uncharacterized protein n=2 Tax=Candidatus Woykeibacteriota TaxID=1817899 RepID=A0A1G1W2H4_9BACT|nr:MAG: hypothetical protein A2113_00935 [Candidatus Woykebacteria bacterium GWA1_44_8]OGY24230.1 MAG: hypothetical protein A2126_00655 [Candidatus Woykebacteria bacterium GWB1_45_5]